MTMDQLRNTPNKHDILDEVSTTSNNKSIVVDSVHNSIGSELVTDSSIESDITSLSPSMIYKPSIISPVDNTVTNSLNVIGSYIEYKHGYVSSEYFGNWEIATDTLFSNIIVSVYNSSVNNRTITPIVPEGVMLYIRYRQNTYDQISEWSDVVSTYVNLGSYVDKPVISNPNNTTILTTGDSLTSSSFISNIPNDTILNAVWSIYDNNGSTIVSNTIALNPYAYTPDYTLLLYNINYVFGVKYVSNTGYTSSEGLLTLTVSKPTSNGIWTTMAPIPEPMIEHTVSVLPNGNILQVGGVNSYIPYTGIGTVREHNIVSNTWSLLPPVPFTIPNTQAHTQTTLLSGDILLVGGRLNNVPRRKCYLYRAGTYIRTDDVPGSGSNRAASILPDGRVIVIAGRDDNNIDTDGVFIYDETSPVGSKWVIQPSLPTGLGTYGMSVVAYDNGNIYAYNGLSVVAKTNISTTTGNLNPWTTVTDPNILTNSRSNLILRKDQTILAPCVNNLPSTNKVYVRDTELGPWRQVVNYPVPATAASICNLPDGRVYVSGGVSNVAGQPMLNSTIISDVNIFN